MRPAPKSPNRRVWCNRKLRCVEAEERAGGVYVRDMSAGDVEAWLPLDAPPPGVCAFCWSEHARTKPHDVESPLYQQRFLIAYGRPPTVADAMAHCSHRMRQRLKERLSEQGLWLLPPPGVAIVSEVMLGSSMRRAP